MTKILWLLLLCLSSMVRAGPLLGSVSAVGLHTVSRHVPDPGLNNLNLGLYVRTSTGVTLGAYPNSFNRDTLYAGWTSPEWNRLSGTIALGTGYRAKEAPMLTDTVSLLTAPTFRLFTVDRMSARLIYIPRFEEWQVEVWHLTLEWKL